MNNNTAKYIKEFLSNNHDVFISDLLFHEIVESEGSEIASPAESLQIALNAISNSKSLEPSEKTHLSEMLNTYHELSIWVENEE